MFDTHAHLNFKDYSKDREDVIKRSLKKDLFMINVGTDYNTSREVDLIAKKYKEGVYASAGLHPLYIKKESDFEYEKYKELTKEEKVVAIGETGLDYKHLVKKDDVDSERTKEAQRNVFLKHINLSREVELPLIIHCRMAHKEMIEFLKREDKGSYRGVVHCFTGNKKEADSYFNLGFFVGINGIIFNLNIDKVLKFIPLERMVLETDCPFLSPVIGQKRNEPLFVEHVAQGIAKVKNIKKEEVLKITTQNAKELFEIK